MKIAVYCGSVPGNDPVYVQAAERLGTWIAENGHTLVFGGGDKGLMGAVAKAAHDHGGQVVGVLPGDVAFICERPQPYCTEVIKAENMAARKQAMFRMADAYIALPGGPGTLDEITEVITLTRLHILNGKSVFFNTDGYYEPIRQFFVQMEAKAFNLPDELSFVKFTDDLDEIGKFLQA